MINSVIIRELVELESGISDISIKNRTMIYPNTRSTYYMLCRLFTDLNLHQIGKSIGRNHATVINGLKMFIRDYGTNKFPNAVYERCFKHLNELFPLDLNVDTFMDNIDANNYYKNTHIELTNKHSKSVEFTKRKNDLINNNNTIRKILELSEEDFIEFEQKFSVFLKVKEKLNKNRHETSNL